MSKLIGYVYLIHFDKPLCHAKHYIGFSEEYPLKKGGRIDKHRKGQGAKILRALVDKGIGFRVVQIWHHQPRGFERKLKNQKNASRICSDCKSLKGRKR